jgi:molecular chaperone Hsp33
VNNYLVNSDQTGSIVLVGVHLNSQGVEAAGGLIVQLLPDHTEETICRLENNISTFGNFTFLMRQGMSLEEILARVLSGFTLQTITPTHAVSFYCKCSPERFCAALKVFGKEELVSMAEEEGKAEGRCHFCNQFYYVDKDQLLELART